MNAPFFFLFFLISFFVLVFRKLVGGIERRQHGTWSAGKRHHRLHTALGPHPEPQSTGSGVCQSKLTGQWGRFRPAQHQWTISHDVFRSGELGGLFDFMPDAYFFNVGTVDVVGEDCNALLWRGGSGTSAKWMIYIFNALLLTDSVFKHWWYWLHSVHSDWKIFKRKQFLFKPWLALSHQCKYKVSWPFLSFDVGLHVLFLSESLFKCCV